MMERFIRILTIGVRPRRLQAWYRRHPRTVIGIVLSEAVAYAAYIRYMNNERKDLLS